jgi:hypothetical protein
MTKTFKLRGNRGNSMWRAGSTHLILLLFLAMPLCALANPQALAIMSKADEANRAKYEIAKMTMLLLDHGKEQMSRELIWYFMNDGNTRTSLLKFTAPPSVQGVGVLIEEDKGKPNAVWNYLPATRNVRRISGELRQNRFMGTELVFEDFEGLKLDKYDYRLLRSEACPESGVCFVVEAQASEAEEKNTSSYSKKIFWINRENFVIVKTELYDRSGVLAKVCEMSGLRQVSGYWRSKRQTMTNLLNGRSTVLLEEDRKLGQPFDKYYVGQQYLRSE